VSSPIAPFETWEGYVEHLKTQNKHFAQRREYLRRIYLPLVEELTWGRKFLDVGYAVDDHITALEDRGWVATGIDQVTKGRLEGDFETYEFKGKKYDFILLGGMLECFKNPVLALQRCHELLSPSGCLLMTTASVDIMWLSGHVHWGHWSHKRHSVYWSMRTLLEQLQRVGLEIILQRQNYSSHFLARNDLHILAQKPYTTAYTEGREGWGVEADHKEYLEAIKQEDAAKLNGHQPNLKLVKGGQDGPT